MNATSLKRSLQLGAAAAAGLGIGWAGVAAMREAAPAPAPANAASPASSRQAPAPAAKDPGAAGGDYQAVKRRWDLWNQLPDGAPQSLERMESSELKELLLSLQKENPKSQGARGMREAIRSAALRELYHRGAETSLKWAEELGSRGSVYLDTMLRIAAKEEPAFAKTWIDRLGPTQRNGWAAELASSAWLGSSVRGAEALLEVEKLFDGQLGRFSFRPEGFADGFDFRRFVKEGKMPASLQQVAISWAARDPDAAFEGVNERVTGGDATENLFGAIFQGMAGMKGDEAAAKWMAGKLEGLPEERRIAAASWLLRSGSPSEARVETLMEAFPRDQDRMIIAKSAIDPFGMDPVGERAGIHALGFLKPEQQREALESTAGSYRQLMKRDPASGKRVQEGFERIMTKLELTEETKARVRAGYAAETGGE